MKINQKKRLDLGVSTSMIIINQFKEKCREYNMPLCVAFVDYEMEFYSVQTQVILTAIQEQGYKRCRYKS